MALHSNQCDVLIVGGGIHGVGVAQAAAAAGYKAVLVEARALAAGTSSKSSKLIHGGLRYLEHGHLKLVRESLFERELLIRLAPGLVQRQAFFLPVYEGMSRPAWQLRAGLSLYAILAGLRKHVGFRSVPKREWSDLDGLQTDGLKQVFQYWDAQTDDAALTRAVMRSAESLGATLLCPANFQNCKLPTQAEPGRCLVSIDVAGDVQTWEAQVVVNAAGPWANEIVQRCTPQLPQLPVDHVQGTHLELPTEVGRGCYYMEVPSDRRAVFVIPWKGRTMLGTTEHVYEGDPALVKPLEVERSYLLDVYRQHFPGKPCDVLDEWSGLRVLPRAAGTAFGRSRETQLPVDNETKPRFVSIFGGKLTGYRATAEKVIARIAGSLPSRSRKATTDELPLAAAPTSRIST
jgi:glycerol-3-phosphate dehydrogenase